MLWKEERARARKFAVEMAELFALLLRLIYEVLRRAAGLEPRDVVNAPFAEEMPFA